MKSKIVIFASGKGSNALQLVEYFKDHISIEIDSVICNRKDAGVFDLLKPLGIPVFYFDRKQIVQANEVLKHLQDRKADWLILAGFLQKVPPAFCSAYENRILNIHPSLLPKFGGKGMYGDHVHQAVLNASEQQSGISIHFVNEDYDSGDMIKQFTCEVSEEETLESLREKIHALEHKYFPRVVEEVILASN